MAFEISFNGINDYATFELGAGIQRGIHEGFPVKVSANKTVSLCNAEDKFSGVLVTIEKDNTCGVVKETGYITLPYSGTAPQAGEDRELVADGNGGVKIPATAGTGKLYRIVDVDSTNKTVTLRLG
ncbi:MAG: hypothetical protein Kow00102_05780 [Spirochaetota bacterium]|nr:hypothetical protein [Spirochaetota bacterium]